MSFRSYVHYVIWWENSWRIGEVISLQQLLLHYDKVLVPMCHFLYILLFLWFYALLWFLICEILIVVVKITIEVMIEDTDLCFCTE